MRLTIVLPLLDQAVAVEASLQELAPMRRRGHRVVVADGGSTDGGPERAAALADRVVRAARGWASLANAGAGTPEAEAADALLFLPPTLRLPPQADRAIAAALGAAASPWGFFDLRLIGIDAAADATVDASVAAAAERGRALPLRVASVLANAGSRATGIGLAEQAIFVTRAAFLALGGYSLAEEPPDMGFCRRARLLGAPVLLRECADVRTAERQALPILWRAARRECWRAACRLDLPWRPQRAPRWSPI
jgi:hypothetical protein